ncbi:cadherin-related tumor suppressor-like [Macrobrachium nipponense]|uniref:cadherin-related tumor suppressor-like n=1 Tax=Macrobrachium nipponense TaxID=159736 RepID=UPI0030C8A6D3
MPSAVGAVSSASSTVMTIIMHPSIMLRLVLVLVLQCLLTNGQGPGPGPGDSFLPEGGVNLDDDEVLDKMQSRSVDTRVKFSVMEGNPANTFVGVIPLKPGFTYRFNEAPREFTLNGTTGEIRTTGVLDREALATDRFDLVVLSSQPTYPIEVRIVVNDTNDNSPRFPEPSIHVSFSESANAGTRVILDTATDGDAGDNDITTNYKIIDGNEDKKFTLQVTINPSGETPYLHLETTGKLDRETRASYQLNISAQDGGSPPRFGFLLVNVSILDVNDNPPIFDHSDYIVSLNESVLPGTSVLQVQATDNDIGDNARLTYYLAESETQFSVDPETGVISTMEPLRCQQNCQQLQPCPKSCVFTVFARDHGSPLQDGRTYVTVNLLDANDHDPVVNFRYFPNTADFATVDEDAQNGTVVAAVSVIDADEGPNGETVVEIRAGNELNHFRLESSGELDIVRVDGVLDREKIRKYNVTIVATDKGTPPRSSTAFLIIHVNDINDHKPVFEKSEYSAVLSELVPIGTYVAGITANDEDTGINSDIYYSIKEDQEENPWFEIDPQSGLITTKALLDRETKDSVDLEIIAKDGGPNPKRANTHLKISILDENDEKPAFEQELINTSLSENTPPDTQVARLLAVDHDQGTNGSVSYMFDEDVEHNYPGVFALDVLSGELRTKMLLDREAIPKYEIKVIAKDQGIPPLSSTATVILDVQDVNDNSPEFYPQQYFVLVPEDLPLSSSVIRVSATDRDAGENAVVSYELNVGEENENTFEIDQDTGIIRLSGRLSHIRKAQYRLTVSARDRGDRKAVEDATVDIVVESNQIELLEFQEQGGYKFSIVEDPGRKEPSIGREVGEVTVLNAASVGEVKYAIVAGDPGKVFVIDERTGTIKTAKRIDREQASSYTLRTVATTTSAYGRTWVNISVTDVNDNPPKFPLTRANAKVAENWPVGHQVYLAKAYDSDYGSNSKIAYSLSNNPDEYFAISRNSGMIFLNKPVKYSKNMKFELEVTATDAGTPPLNSRQIVTIEVEDVNDHTPIFEHGSYETSLLESTPVNDRFFALTASDEDDGLNGFVSYDITEGNEEKKFGIFPDGYLYVRSALDREAQDYFALTIVARDHGQPPRSSTVSVVIHVIDENDNSPAFTNKTFTFYLDENEPPDTYVGKLTAVDRDKGRNAELTYSIATNQNDFIVDPKSGFLKTIRYFDREHLVKTTGMDYISMEAIVLDNGITRLRDKAKVNIYITDVNDNPPKFLRRPYTAPILEGAALNTQVIRISASDADEGLNGDVVYTIIDGNEEGRFKVDETTGQVTLAKNLDRETTPRYLLTVAAADLGSQHRLSATATLTIDVLDENDNAPEFTQSESEIYIAETEPVNTVLVQFQASDADLRMNKEVSFMIGGGNMQEAFRIDTKTGILYLDRILDFEKQSLYRLNITAADGGTPRLTSTISFVVHVLDKNDNPPAFPNTDLWRRIEEGIPPDSCVVSVTAEDPDSGVNGKIKYTIKSQEPPGMHFTINDTTGEVRTRLDIDREFSDTFRLTVVATDQAEKISERLSAEKLVTVIVEDINDNAPQFVSMNAGILKEGSPAGTEIMRVSARDLDANTNGLVAYEMVGGNQDIFSLDRKTGALRLARMVTSPEITYSVTVRATDEAVQSQRKSSDAYLTILSQSSQEGPQFSQESYSGSVMESSSIGTSVATVSATLGSDNPDDITYYVVNVTDADGVSVDRLFAVQQQGVVATAEVLDREEGSETYVVTVAAVVMKGDTPRLSTTQVRVTVQDKNDSPPSFGDLPLRFTVSEDMLAGRQIATIKATDPDTLGTLTYSLVDGDDNRFALDAETGSLSLQETLDRETKSEYELTVRADDGEQHTDTTIYIKVTDTNDNPPEFKEPAYSFDIPEDAERGSKVGKVSATDADEGTNGQVSYTVISDWGNDVFSLNPQTGVFTLTSRLDYEQVQHYILVVQAQDTGTPSLSSTVTVYFNVQDLNDNAPIFDPMSYSDEVFENITVGSSVLSVSATDQDSGLNGRLVYTISGGDEKNQFSISENGTIYTRAPLDREDQSFYNLVVRASDMAQPPLVRLSSTVQVTIILRDVNDMAPEFVSPNETTVAENTPVTTVVMAVKAVDSDEGRNSYIEYSLAPVPDNRFALGPVDGLLRIIAPLDREDRANYSLVVTARDRGNPPNAHTLTISLRVIDENDNSPIFDPKQYSASVPENASIGLSVLQVSATDADESLNGRVRYTIVAGDKNRDFSISEDTGVIRVAKNLNYERRNHYLLTVQAEDSGVDVRYDTATVTISIMDINDNAPVFLDSPYLVYVMENMAALPAPIATVTAFDADNPPYNRVNYLVKEGDKSVFSVNATSGQINLLRALDREDRDHYTLTVVAMDTGTPRLTGTGTISVLVQDENDHAPKFDKDEYEAAVSESVLPDTQVIQVAATDRDAGANAKIRYSLVEGAAGVFMVEEWTGIIRTVAHLDRESVSRYSLILQAQDSSLTEPRTATTQLMVTITDENDNAPTFSQSQYHIYVPDPTAPGNFVFGGEAIDPDEGINGQVTYYLSGNDADKFSMNQETGVIKASTDLSGDTKYSLEVLATDSGEQPLSATAKLTVSLQPNNLFPVFQPLEKTFSFSEAAREDLVTTLTATSPKVGPNGNVLYSIAGGNIGQAFTVDEETGELRVSKFGLDYETASRYEIWVAAQDSDDPPLTSVTHLVVDVTDYNDNAPVFSQPVYNASILEEQYPPQLVATVSATDKDSGTNAQVMYQLRRDSPAAEAFTLDAETGQIFTKIKLDREEVEVYTLTVEAVDKGTPAQTGTAMVVVTVQDKNDNPPRFTRLFSINVTENAEIGTFVIQVTSSDRDIGDNANATYSFTENPDGKFHIDPVSGNVTVASAIDRELKDEHSLKVVAVDGSWRAETSLTVTVQDENDNAPEFEQSAYVFNFPELQQSVASVGQVTATDQDKQGPNSVISYSLKFPSDFFSVDPASGEILSKQALKYKHTLKGPSPENQYQLAVVATDNGKPPMSSESSVIINVVDANNNPPKFSEDSYFTPVPESSEIGQKIIQLQATDDRDFGINAEIEYQKVSGNGSDYFMLEPKTGWITVARTLEGRVNTHFDLTVRAVDQGVPPLQDEVKVILVVTGENLHTPKFTALSHQVIVPENEPLGSAIGTPLTATDDDTGPNGIVRFSITSGNEAGKFAIDETTGAVTIMHPLDYDAVQEYRLNITARDLGFEPHYSTAVLTIILTDINDNPPKFDQPKYDAYIAENANANTTVFQLNATDIDSSRNAIIQYTLVGGDGKDFFAINPNTGVVTSRRVFDYEEKSRYVLDVRASNTQDPSQWGSTKVIVHVTGRNEFFPKFIQPVFQFTVSESAKIGTSVGTIQATDDDKGEDGLVYYLLVGASNDRGFLIQPMTGVITVARSLDRESQNRVVLTVMAKNAGSIRGNDTDEAQITISIQDGNDPPVFSQPLYEKRLSEGAFIGTHVLTVTAKDSDVRPKNNQFTYSIIGGNLGQVFKVDPQSGKIETTALLDRETIQVYNLTVGAIDNGSPPQTGTTLVRVILDDVNDNGPQFDPPDIVGYVAENEPAMTSVMTLSATDPDLAPNTQPFTYYIVGGEHKEFFMIDEATGEVKTTRSIDRETTPELTFRIEVEDSGKPKMKSEYPVNIIVLDKNDSPSNPRTVTVKVQTYNGIFPGGKVADVHPNDADTAGQYSCQILTQDAAIFSIPNACNLHAATVQQDRTYTLSVSGNDGKHQDVTSKVTLEFESFDNKTLNSSLTLRLLNVTADRFLRLYYTPFIDTLPTLFSGRKVRIYSMLNVDSHTDLTLTVAGSRSNSYLPPAEVTRKLAAEEQKLTQSLQGLQLIVDYNPCSDAPCKNGGECSHGIHAYDETEITDSPNFIFTSPLIRHDVSCRCHQGFTGPRCELRQDPCSPNPCQYGGTCTRKGFVFSCACPPSRQGPQCEFDKTNACDNNPCSNGGTCQTTLEGGFFCLCRPGYRGNQCELASESCRPNPCVNGGSCISLKPGYQCSCKLNFYGTHCEKSTFSFSELSFMTFPTLDPTTNDISITFSTNKPDALLVYNYGLQTGGRSDFVAIELKGGQPRFSFGGARTEIVRIGVEQNVADGKWYKVTATRNGRVISISVASCTHNGETCEECSPHNSSCHSDDIGFTGTLNFNNEPMYLGGVMTVDPLQERPDQVVADDFIGCIQAVSINGRPLNLSGPIQERGISDTCERVRDVCAGNPCGKGATCLDRWSTHMCRCANGLVAPDCDAALRPASFTRDAYVEFLITEQHRRRQLLPRLYQQHSRWSREANAPPIVRSRKARQAPPPPPKSLSFNFQTRMSNGVLLHAATNNDYTLVEIRNGRLQYTSKLGANQPINMTVSDPLVNDGSLHNLTLLAEQSALKLMLDGEQVGDELDFHLMHDFLDAYLTSLTLGSAPKFSGQLPYDLEGFVGCMSTFSVDNEVQPLNSTGSLLEAVAHGVSLVSECTGSDLGPATSTDPLSIGITLVIVFFVLLLVAILVSFIVYRVRRQRREKGGVHVKQNGSALLANTSSDSGRSPQDSNYVESAEMTDDVLRSHLSQELATKKYKERDHERPQRPDIIEREVMNKSPGVPLRVEESQMQERDTMAGLGHIPDSEAPEHYDLENASSIAPSDIDIVYHYKGYRDGNVRKYKTNPHVPGYHKHNHRHSPHNFPNTPHRESPRNIMRQSPNPVAPRESPSVLKMQATPLARLSPSSELSQQTPRILTLQDISGKPLQTALLATSQGPGVKDVMSTSERSLNSPVSHLSQSSGSMHASSQSTKKKKHDSSVSLGLTAEEIERLNTRPRNSSLVSTLDAVSSSSEDNQRKDKLAELLETNTELLEPPDSSTDESGNDSFTCSEFEYENNYEKVTRDFGPGNMIFSKLAEVDNENEHDNESAKNYDGFDSFRGSLSTLVASDDDLSNMSSYKPPNGSTFGWDYLLNWGPNFESLVGVFKDIAELPDNTTNGRVSARGTPKPNEEYV